MRTRRLIVVTPEGERELLFIGRLTAGRAPECDISIADTKISRRHAEFDASGPVPRVTDLGSRNGILVNGRKVGGADLSPGDVVTIGDALVRFEEQAVASPPPEVPGGAATDDRTAIIPPAHLAAPPLSAAAPVGEPVPLDLHLVAPDPARGVGGAGAAAPAAAPPSAAVAVLSAAVDAAPAASARLETPADDRTAVLPRPPLRPQPRPEPRAEPRAEPGSGRPSELPGGMGTDPGRADVHKTGPVSVAPASADAPAPPGAAPVSAVPKSSPPAVGRSGATAAPPTAGGTPPSAAPAAVPAPVPAAAATAGAAPRATGGPRLSWGGFLIILLVLLASAGVLLGVLPLLSATSTTIDALATRQARTLVGWLGSAVREDGSVDERTVETVLQQDGVSDAVLLEAQSGRIVAPARLLGRTMNALPGSGANWRNLSAPVVSTTAGTARDAVAPVSRGPVAHVAWVRYEPPPGSDSGLALIVAVGSTLVLALVVSILIKRHTAATLQLFTRQVELAVSGADAKVMQPALIPGLERLPGIVSYLLEQRKQQGFGADAGDGTAAGSLAPAALMAPPPPPEPAWLEITPSLSIEQASPTAAPGIAGWEAARGRHLLDVVTDGATRNAVVQALGALGMAAGAEVSVPVDGQAPVTLRREPSGHVRVTFAAR